jgi:F-type H+-transporting ATPase subunit gamma
MPANLKDLRTRIRSVRNTEQITKAMKLVSTAKFGRAQVAVVHAKPYSRALVKMVRDVVETLGDGASHPLMKPSQSPVTHLVVVSSERGLCGSYNSQVTKQVLKTVNDELEAGRKVSITCLGKKSYQTLVRSLASKGFVSKQCSLEDFEKQADQMFEQGVIRLITTQHEKRAKTFSEIFSRALAVGYEHGGFGKLLCIYTRFESAGSMPLSVDTFLPFGQALLKSDKGSAVEPSFEPAAAFVLDALLPRYLGTAVFQLLLESVASEHGSRMAAMDSASRNAKEMMRKLQITYQRARQAAITRELIEIVSGAEAL